MPSTNQFVQGGSYCIRANKKKLFSIETKKNHTLMWNMDGSSVRPVGSILETSLEHDGGGGGGGEERKKKKKKKKEKK